MPRKSYFAAFLALIAIAAAVLTGLYLYDPQTSNLEPSSQIPVVAGENFWGSLISQLGGSHVQVTSVVSDPNADPHEYETSAADARAVADARLVIVNGAGYDDWALRLVAASATPGQKVLNIADLLGKKDGDNPHFWYSPLYVNETLRAMYQNLVSIDPGGMNYYEQQYSDLNVSLGTYNSRVEDIRANFVTTRVAATEDIFEYLANATGLDLISPPEFTHAVAEGIDPTPQSQALFYRQIVNASSPGNATVLVYNQQTVTPLTQDIKARAVADGLGVVGVTETIQPPDAKFQDWMNSQLQYLYNALNSSTLGK